MLLVVAALCIFLLPAPWNVVAVPVAAVVEIAELLLWRRFLRRYRLRSGPETMIGAAATVVEDCSPAGRVRIRGELWNARSARGAAAGETVRVAAMDGLTLEVEPDA